MVNLFRGDNLEQQIDLRHIQPLADEILALEWFSHCGEKTLPDYGFPAAYCARGKAMTKIRSLAWDNIRLEAVNALTEYLSLHHRTLYDTTYNPLVIAIKDVFMQPIQERVVPVADASFGKEAANVWRAVSWDVLHMLIGAHFEEYFRMPLYYDLLAVYRSGHLPAGMLFAYPDNELLIY